MKDLPEECDYFQLLPNEIQRIIYQYMIGSQLQEQKQPRWPSLMMEIQLLPFCTARQFIIPPPMTFNSAVCSPAALGAISAK